MNRILFFITPFIIFCLLISTSIPNETTLDNQQINLTGNYVLYRYGLLILKKVDNKSYDVFFGTDYVGKQQGNRVSISYGSYPKPIEIGFILAEDGVNIHFNYEGETIKYAGRKIVDHSLWSAITAYYKGNYKFAETGLQSYLNSHSNDLFVRLCWADCLAQIGKITESKREILKIENNPEIQTNLYFKQYYIWTKFLITGKELSAIGQNAWDDYQQVNDLVSFDMDSKLEKEINQYIHIGTDERSAMLLYISPNRRAIDKLLQVPEKHECYVTQGRPYNLKLHVVGKAVGVYGRLLVEEGRLNEAVEAYRRVIRMGQQMRKGILIYQLIGASIRTIGENGLGRIYSENKIQTLEQAQLLFNTIKKLRRTDYIATQESMYKLEPEEDMKKHFFGTENISLRFHIAETKLILLETVAAIRLHYLKTGNYPVTTMKLIPKYLSDEPKDTFNNNPIKLRWLNKKLISYSYGPDLIDNEGLIQYDPTNGTLSQGDLFYSNIISSN